MLAQSQIQIAKHVNKRGMKMLNWDDPLSTVQNKEKTNFKAQGEVNLKTSISDTNKSKIPSEKFI